jgi:hypothetical protein
MELRTCFEMGATGHRMIARELRHTSAAIFCNALHTRSSRRRLFDVAERTASRSVEQGGGCMAFWLLFSALLLAKEAHAQPQPDSTMPVAGELMSPIERRSEPSVSLDPDWLATLVRELNVHGDLGHSLIAQLLIQSEPDNQSQ